MSLITEETARQIKQGNIRTAAERIVTQMTRENDGQVPRGLTKSDAVGVVMGWLEAEAARKSAARLVQSADERLGQTLGVGWGSRVVSDMITAEHR